MSADIDALRASVDIVDVVSRYVELKQEGAEYVCCCVFHSENTPSMKVNRQKQIWSCFGCNENEKFGSDVFGFLRSYHQCTFPEAVEKLSNGNGSLPDAKPIARPPLKKAPPRQLLVPPFGDEPDMKHSKLGDPLKVWTFHTLDGEPWFFECRYGALSGEGKQTRPWSYGRYSDTDPPKWESKWPEAPRPFWGLEVLTDRPAAQVMIHEAAKKAEAARVLFPALVHLGLCGGAGVVKHTDLAPLRGRRCVLLPDNDEPGKQAMSRLAPLLWAAGAVEVKGIDPETQPDGSLSPVGWDIADWPLTDDAKDDSKRALQWCKARVVIYPNEAAQPASGSPSNSTAPVAAASPLNAVPVVGLPAGGSSPSAPTPGPHPNAPGAADPPGPPQTTTPRPKGQPAKPTLGVVEGTGAVRKPNLEIEPEAELLPAFSEFALASRFVAGQGEDWRYTAAWATWAKWDGTRWVPDERLRVRWDVKACCQEAMKEHAAQSTPAQRLKITTLKTVRAVEGIIQSDPKVATGAQEWDADPMLLGTPGGLIDLRTGATVPALKEHLISRSTSVAPEAGPHPWWTRVISRPHGGAIVDFLQLWCGYILTGDTREERFLFIHGPGGGGKSKFLGVVSEILADYRRAAPMDAFTVRAHHEHSEEIARLAGARLVIAAETDEGARWNEARIKQMTGRDVITARHMRMSSFEFLPQFKLVFIGNHRPAMRSVGEEMRRRIDLVDWGGTIPESERILDLPDKLRAEYPAILAWMIEGCLRWQKSGLGKPQQVSASVADYIQGEDTLGAWLEECATVKQDSRTRSSDAYHSFKHWAEQAGEFVPSQKRFTQRLRERGFETIKSGERYFIGLRLNEPEMDEPPASWVPD